MPRCKLNLGNCGNFAGKGLFLAVPIVGFMAIVASFFSVQLGSSRQLTPPGPISDDFFDNSMQLTFLPHPVEPTGLTARVSQGVVATAFYSSTSLLVVVFRHTA